jgi:hypothetical protein
MWGRRQTEPLFRRFSRASFLLLQDGQASGLHAERIAWCNPSGFDSNLESGSRQYVAGGAKTKAILANSVLVSMFRITKVKSFVASTSDSNFPNGGTVRRAHRNWLTVRSMNPATSASLASDGSRYLTCLGNIPHQLDAIPFGLRECQGRTCAIRWPQTAFAKVSSPAGPIAAISADIGSYSSRGRSRRRAPAGRLLDLGLRFGFLPGKTPPSRSPCCRTGRLS